MLHRDPARCSLLDAGRASRQGPRDASSCPPHHRPSAYTPWSHPVACLDYTDTPGMRDTTLSKKAQRMVYMKKLSIYYIVDIIEDIGRWTSHFPRIGASASLTKAKLCCSVNHPVQLRSTLVLRYSMGTGCHAHLRSSSIVGFRVVAIVPQDRHRLHLDLGRHIGVIVVVAIPCGSVACRSLRLFYGQRRRHLLVVIVILK